MDARIIGQNAQGGRVIEVFIPAGVVERAEEITARVENGELHEETTARELWLNQIQPSVDKALNGLETDWARDQIVLRSAASISTLKHPNRSGPQSGVLSRPRPR